jgi:hypothetical protein
MVIVLVCDKCRVKPKTIKLVLATSPLNTQQSAKDF